MKRKLFISTITAFPVTFFMICLIINIQIKAFNKKHSADESVFQSIIEYYFRINELDIIIEITTIYVIVTIIILLIQLIMKWFRKTEPVNY